MGRVLVVAYRFPPHGGGGVQRTTYFVRHLRDFGWKPHVLTGPLGAYRLEDDQLLKLLPPELPVTRTGRLPTALVQSLFSKIRLGDLARGVTPSYPNMEAGWIPVATRAGLRLLATGEFDLIYSSAYPMGSHRVAFALKKATGLPWVADYRDEWSTRDVLRWPSRHHQRAARRIDRQVIQGADLVVTTSPAHTDILSRNFAGGDTSRFRMITNGFDESDFNLPPSTVDEETSNRFLLTHVGSVFRWRGADNVIAAAEELKRAGRAERLLLNFVGQTGALRSSLLQEHQALRVQGYVTHRQAIAWMMGSSALLLINTEVSNIPGKTFEYLAARRPILAAVREGPTADLIRQMGAGPVVAPDAPADIAEAIFGMYERWRTGTLGPPAYRSLEPYTRRALTRRLANAFDNLVQDAHRPEKAASLNDGRSS